MDRDIPLICVGMTVGEDGSLNLEYIYQTAKQIGEVLKNKNTFHITVIRSTVISETNQRVSEIISEISGKKVNIDFEVVPIRNFFLRV